MNITLRQIEGFLAAAETLSFSGAAVRLHMTQSAFSQLIRDIETALGVRLFHRTTRRVRLTDSGAALVQKMRSGLTTIEEACQDAGAISRLERGHLSLATLPSLALGFVTQALGDLRRLFPGVTVSLLEAQNPDLLDMVSQSRVELVVCAQASAEASLEFERLFAEELVAVVPESHPLAGRKSQRWTRLRGESLILMTQHSSTRRIIAAALSSNGLDDRPAYEVTSLFTALSMVRAGLGITVVPMTALLEVNFSGLAGCRLTRPAAVRQIGMYRRRDREPSPAAQEFVRLVKMRVEGSLQPGIQTATR